MQVQINLNAPFEYKAGQKIKPFDFCGDIVLATDPGKTNMALRSVRSCVSYSSGPLGLPTIPPTTAMISRIS